MKDEISILLQILEIVAYFGGAGVVLVTITRAVTKFEMIGKQQAMEIGKMQTTLDKMEGIMTQMAVEKVRLDNQGQRLTQLERLVDDIRRGEGMILPLDFGRKLPGGD